MSAEWDVDRALQYALEAVDSAQRAGASQAEATLSITERFECEARERTVVKLERSAGRLLQLRIFAGGRKATLATSDFDREGLQRAVERVIGQARHVAHDPFSSLPDSVQADAAPDLELFSPEVAARDAQTKIEEALALEARIRELDTRIVNSNGSHVGDAVSTRALVNSNGFAGAYRSTRVHRSSSPVAHDGDAKRTGSYGSSARSIDGMETQEAVARKAVQRTIELFGARKPPTMRLPVIFERDVAGSVLSDVFSAVSASNVASGNSWLAGRIGTKVGSDLVTIADDGRLAGFLGSSPFDAEGIPTQRTTVFDRGVLRSFLYDTYYARKLGSKSTGNSAGGAVGPNNFFLEPGTLSRDQLVAATSRGILVLDTIGFATEHASGTYSRGARGFYIENGEVAYPIEECTIAGTFPEMLAAIDAVAGDLWFDGSVVAPSFRVAEMTVSGD